MFTGIVEAVGTVLSRRPDRLTVAAPRAFGPAAVGESVCVDGVCLTVERRQGAGIVFRLLPETARVSTLGGLAKGSRVNLERALRAGSRLGGHLLLGHVDARGAITRRSFCRTRGTSFAHPPHGGYPGSVARLGAGGSVTLEIRVPEALAPLLVPKGPIAVDGVSLTLDGRTERDRVRVHLVSHTLESTTLGGKAEGSRVNLEVDLVAKYLRGMLS